MKLRVAQIWIRLTLISLGFFLYAHVPCVCVRACVRVCLRACVKGVGVQIQILPIDRKIDCKTEPEILSREKHCN